MQQLQAEVAVGVLDGHGFVLHARPERMLLVRLSWPCLQVLSLQVPVRRPVLGLFLRRLLQRCMSVGGTE